MTTPIHTNGPQPEVWEPLPEGWYAWVEDDTSVLVRGNTLTTLFDSEGQPATLPPDVRLCRRVKP